MHPTSPDRAAKANGVQPRVGIWHPRSLRSKDAIQPCDRLNAQLRHGHVTMGMAPNKEAPSTPHDRWGPWIRWPSLTCTTGMNPSTAPVVDLSLIFLPLMACPAIKKQRASMHESWDTQKARQGKSESAREKGAGWCLDTLWVWEQQTGDCAPRKMEWSGGARSFSAGS